MSVLFRYLIKEYLRVFFLALFSFLVLFQVFDFIERYEYYFRNNPDFKVVLALVGLKTLPALALVIPVATLLGSVISLAVLNRNSELIAMRSCGVGFRRLAHPLLWCGLASSLVVVSLNEFVLPSINERIHFMEAVKVRGAESITYFKKDHIWFKDRGRVYHMDLFLPGDGLMRGLTLYDLDAQGLPARRLSAAEGRLEDGKWIFSGIMVADMTGDAPRVVSGTTEVPFPYDTDSLSILEKRPDEMNFAELRTFIRKMSHERLRTNIYETEMHGRLSFGLVSLLLAIVGLPFANRPTRHGGAMTAIALAIAVGFSYWFVFSFALTLGKNGYVSPFLAAWTPNVLFGWGLMYFYRKIG
jgi:lipopolysaccharide export system permease protein